MDKPAVIIDNGSFMCKAGFARQDIPLVECRSICGVPRIMAAELGLRDSYVGSEALRRRGILTLKYPVEGGIITDWSDMEKVLKRGS